VVTEHGPAGASGFGPLRQGRHFAKIITNMVFGLRCLLDNIRGGDIYGKKQKSRSAKEHCDRGMACVLRARPKKQ